MGQDERDIVEFSDEEGNTLLLEVMDYFFYNGEEFAVLCDADEEACDCADACCDDSCDDDCEHEHSLYIMKVVTTTNEDGEEMEEFLPIEDELLEKLIPIVQQRYSDDEIVGDDGFDDEDEDLDDGEDADNDSEDDDEDEDEDE